MVDVATVCKAPEEITQPSGPMPKNQNLFLSNERKRHAGITSFYARIV